MNMPLAYSFKYEKNSRCFKYYELYTLFELRLIEETYSYSRNILVKKRKKTEKKTSYVRCFIIYNLQNQ